MWRALVYVGPPSDRLVGIDRLRSRGDSSQPRARIRHTHEDLKVANRFSRKGTDLWQASFAIRGMCAVLSRSIVSSRPASFDDTW